MGKWAISMVIFNSYVTNYQRVTSNMTQSQILVSAPRSCSAESWCVRRSQDPPPSVNVNFCSSIIQQKHRKNIQNSLVVWDIWIIFPYIGNNFNHPNWRTHIFQRGRSTTNQKKMAKNVGHDVFGLQRGTHFPSDLDLHKLLALIWVWLKLGNP